MAYKISITGIKDPSKIQELIKLIANHSGLQVKTVAESLKKIPLVIPIIQDEMKAKALFVELEAAGAAIEISQTKDSLLNPEEPEESEDPRKYKSFSESEKVPRVLYNFKQSQSKSNRRQKKIIWSGVVFIILIFSLPLLFKDLTPKAKKSFTHTKHSDKKQGRAQKQAPPPGSKTTSTPSVNQYYNPSNSDKKGSDKTPSAVEKIQVVKARENLVLVPSSKTGQGIPEEIDTATPEGRFHLSLLREAKANELKTNAKKQGLTPREKIAILKKSLNLNPYDQDSWRDLKNELKGQNKHNELVQIEKIERKAFKNSQEILEEISRSIGGTSTQVEQSISEIKFRFSKSYTNPSEFKNDAQAVFDKFRIKYPHRRIIIEDRTELNKIYVEAGDPLSE